MRAEVLAACHGLLLVGRNLDDPSVYHLTQEMRPRPANGAECSTKVMDDGQAAWTQSNGICW